MSQVICIGELLIDMVNVDHQGLKKGLHFEKKAGGAPANVACAITKMNQKASFMGQIGQDHFGMFLSEVLQTYHIDLSFAHEGGTTTIALVGVDEQGERSFAFIRGCDACYELNEQDLSLIQKNDLIHFGSATAFLEGKLKESYKALKEYALKNHLFISFDPNYRESLIVDQKQFIQDCQAFIAVSDFVKMSEEEALMISQCSSIEKACDLFTQWGAQCICITLGAKGTLLWVKDTKQMIPSIPVKQVDSCGAGDAFVGVMLAQIVSQSVRKFTFEQWCEMCKRANVAGALTCTQFGAMASIPTQSRIIEEMEKNGYL